MSRRNSPGFFQTPKLRMRFHPAAEVRWHQLEISEPYALIGSYLPQRAPSVEEAKRFVDELRAARQGTPTGVDEGYVYIFSADANTAEIREVSDINFRAIFPTRIVLEAAEQWLGYLQQQAAQRAGRR